MQLESQVEIELNLSLVENKSPYKDFQKKTVIV